MEYILSLKRIFYNMRKTHPQELGLQYIGILRNLLCISLLSDYIEDSRSIYDTSFGLVNRMMKEVLKREASSRKRML